MFFFFLFFLNLRSAKNWENNFIEAAIIDCLGIAGWNEQVFISGKMKHANAYLAFFVRVRSLLSLKVGGHIHITNVKCNQIKYFFECIHRITYTQH